MNPKSKRKFEIFLDYDKIIDDKQSKNYVGEILTRTQYSKHV